MSDNPQYFVKQLLQRSRTRTYLEFFFLKQCCLNKECWSARLLGASIKQTGIVSHSSLSARHGINIVFYFMKRAPHTHTLLCYRIFPTASRAASHQNMWTNTRRISKIKAKFLLNYVCLLTRSIKSWKL